MPCKYEIPPFLKDEQSQEAYGKWLHRRAQAHAKRDRKHGNKTATTAAYKKAIHDAVLKSNGLDAYTGERLEWSLISCYNNNDAGQGRLEYKRRFALLPSVDHAAGRLGDVEFKICSWRTNDCKNDLSLAELRQFCLKILKKRWDDQ